MLETGGVMHLFVAPPVPLQAGYKSSPKSREDRLCRAHAWRIPSLAFANRSLGAPTSADGKQTKSRGEQQQKPAKMAVLSSSGRPAHSSLVTA